MIVECFTLNITNNQELQIIQYPNMMIESITSLEKILYQHNVNSCLTFKEDATKSYIINLRLRENFNKITLLKFSDPIMISSEDKIHYFVSGDYLFLNLSFCETLHILQRVDALYKLKSFW